MQTREFLQQKITNFKQFIDKMFDAAKEAANVAKLKDDYVAFCNLPAEAFLSVVQSQFVPQRENLSGFIDIIMNQRQIDKSHINSEDLSKLIRYLEMFCELTAST